MATATIGTNSTIGPRVKAMLHAFRIVTLEVNGQIHASAVRAAEKGV
jgi:hypothetical protein